MAKQPAVLIDLPSGPEGSPDKPLAARMRHAFGTPKTWLVAHRMDHVADVIDQAHQLAQAGHWCVGFVAYEAAPAFDTALITHPANRSLPLAAFAVFDQPQTWPSIELTGWHTPTWTTSLSPDEFVTQVGAIHELIRAGEVYQINLTSPLRNSLTGDAANVPLAYFGALHRTQPLAYNIYLNLAQPDQEGKTASKAAGVSHILSVSPELFFHWDQGGQLVTRPMKGTAGRGDTPAADEQAAQHLRNSPKERAENLMIVDLLRNDLSRVAKVGTVQVPRLFDVQALPTVWQMTSTIEASAKPDLRLSEVFAALFPCGSITGAPKQRAMHHITELEEQPRGAYCGAIGVIQPGGQCTFNVAIRTVELTPSSTPDKWKARCSIGSGITLDATPIGEALEWHHKQGFLRRASAPFELLESLRMEHGQLERLPLHLDRLRRAALHFGFPLDEDALEAELNQLGQQHPHGLFKVRLLVDGKGQVSAQAAPLADNTTPIKVRLAKEAMTPPDEFIWHKTTRRDAYQAFPPAAGCFDTLLFNAQGELTEFTIGNVAVRIGGQWCTPPVACGLLPGVMRHNLLVNGKLFERVISVNDLHHADGMALINSVRGWVEIDWLDFTQHLPGSKAQQTHH